MMPGKNGFEALNELKGDTKTKDIPVIVITALDSNQDDTLKQQPGVVHILSKPVAPKDLQDALKKYPGPPRNSKPGEPVSRKDPP